MTWFAFVPIISPVDIISSKCISCITKCCDVFYKCFPWIIKVFWKFFFFKNWCTLSVIQNFILGIFFSKFEIQMFQSLINTKNNTNNTVNISQMTSSDLRVLCMTFIFMRPDLKGQNLKSNYESLPSNIYQKKFYNVRRAPLIFRRFLLCKGLFLPRKVLRTGHLFFPTFEIAQHWCPHYQI